MSKLGALQQAFQAYVLHADDAMRQEVASTLRASAEIRLDIYASAYRLRLIEALQTEYTALHAALGDEAFEQLCMAYLDAHPSSYRNLRWFGGDLSVFLRTTPPYADTPILAELAAFEWAMGLAFDAADAPSLSLPEIAAVPGAAWPAMSFQAHPAVHRLDLHSNAPLLWKAVDAEDDPPPATHATHPVAWVVWRQDLRIFFRSMAVDEAWAFDALRRGATFADICAGLCEWISELQVAQHAAGLLKGWVESGMLWRVYSEAGHDASRH